MGTRCAAGLQLFNAASNDAGLREGFSRRSSRAGDWRNQGERVLPGGVDGRLLRFCMFSWTAERVHSSSPCGTAEARDANAYSGEHSCRFRDCARTAGGRAQSGLLPLRPAGLQLRSGRNGLFSAASGNQAINAAEKKNSSLSASDAETRAGHAQPPQELGEH